MQESVSPSGLVLNGKRFPVPDGTGISCSALRAIVKRNIKTDASGCPKPMADSKSRLQDLRDVLVGYSLAAP